MAPNQEEEEERQRQQQLLQQLQQLSSKKNSTMLMCYGKVIEGGTAWKSFLKAVCYQNTKSPWEINEKFLSVGVSSWVPPVNQDVQFGSKTVNVRCPPVSYSRVPNYAVLDAALQSSDGYILFVEGHYCRPDSYVETLMNSLVGRSDEDYAQPFHYRPPSPVEAIAHKSYPKKSANKTRGVVVVLCGDNDEVWYHSKTPSLDPFKYENAKKEWEEFCKKEGYPCFEFNCKDTEEKIKETATKIVEALLAEIKAGKGIKVKTEHFPQDLDFTTKTTTKQHFPTLRIEQKSQQESSGPWVRFKKFIGLSKTVAA